MILKRKQISDGIFFSTVTDGKFKTNRISVTFYTGFDKGTRSDYAIIPYILTDGCRKYPNLTRLTEKYSDLYGASLSDGLNYDFDCRSMTFTMSFIDDRYTLFGERLEQECCELLLDCLLDPRLDGGCFDAETVNIMKQELIDAVASVKGDKRLYAAQQGARAAYKGEPCDTPINGSIEDAAAVTPESAYAAYVDMLENSRIEIFAAGRSDFSVSERIFADRLGKIRRGTPVVLCTVPSPLKEEVFRVTEGVKAQQAILRMYFKAPQIDDRFAGTLFTQILGGTDTSRFFTNIREKRSLCYYCAAVSYRFKKTLVAYSGVDPANLAETEHAIMSELMTISMNGVTEEELAQAKLSTIETVRGVYDSARAISSWYSSQIADAEMLTPEQFIDEINKVSAQRVMKVCRMYCLDTVYIMRPEEVDS